MLKAMLLRGAEQAVNAMLSRQMPAQAIARRALADKTVHVRLTDFKQDFYLLFTADTVLLQSTCAEPADLTIDGDLAAFLQMTTQRDGRLPQRIKLTGSAHLAQTLQRFFAAANIDWQENLSGMIGDTAATAIGDAVDKTKAVTQRGLERLRLDTGEFLREERQYFASRKRVEHYCRRIDELRHRLSRLDARVARLPRPEDIKSCKSSD